jgi:hypothetical protein
LIALESEVVGAGEEEEGGEDIWLPRKRQGRTSGCSRIFLVLQIRKVSCAPSLTVFLSPISVAYKLFCIFSFSILLSFCYMEMFIYVGFAPGSE